MLDDAQMKNSLSQLLAQMKLLDDCLITLGSTILEVIEKTAALGHHLEKAATGGVILGVAFEVFGEGGDPLGEVGHLDIGAAGVLFMQPECRSYCGFCCRHFFEGEEHIPNTCTLTRVFVGLADYVSQ